MITWKEALDLEEGILNRRSFLGWSLAGLGPVAFFPSLPLAAGPRQQSPGRGVQSGGEVLPNGIRLPKKWPPQVDWEEIEARKSLPEPPYLQSPPAVIPIDGALRGQTGMAVPEALTRFPQSILGLLPGLG